MRDKPSGAGARAVDGCRRRSEGGSATVGCWKGARKVDKRRTEGGTHRPNFGQLIGDLLGMRNLTPSHLAAPMPLDQSDAVVHKSGGRPAADRVGPGVALESPRRPAGALRVHKSRFGVGPQRPISGTSMWIVSVARTAAPSTRRPGGRTRVALESDPGDQFRPPRWGLLLHEHRAHA